ncbi:MAG: sterol desaturase family protein [Deltaproteobacteria bacterium]|nr:sterol desaturase family protein [Deltaproteobacteria bacterium]
MSYLPFVALTAAVALAMEFWARFLHGQVWHRHLWWAHASHHRTRTGFFEFNDVFAVLHAGVAVGLIAWGEAGQGWAALGGPRWWALAMGAGMTAFGAAYFVVHDGLAHGRLPVQFLARVRWLRRLRNAHRAHHRGGRQEDGPPFGLFLGPQELKKASRAARLQHRQARAAAA